MPSTLTGVVLFVVLLCPGFIFLQRREQFHSGVTYTALRETSLVLLASMATLVISVGVLGTARLIAPESTPDLGRYVREFDAYFKAHYVEAATWGLGVLAIACVLAYWTAVPPRWVDKALRRAHRHDVADWVDRWRGSDRIDSLSGWAKAKAIHPDHEQWVDVMLTDGSFLHGRLYSANPQLDETADRDLLISSPINTRRLNGDVVPMPDWGVVVVNASKINYVAWKYFPVGHVGQSVDPPQHQP